MHKMQGKSGQFSRRLLQWYHTNRRQLPWRAERVDPYHTLISEVMLQQTQVATVVPYFHRFVARFPTAEALAKAELQEVLKLWQGLGYYSRARNLQAAARKVVEEFGGKIPRTVAELLTLPGIGRYSAGAICSIAFDERAPILDGNVARVLCRIDAIMNDPKEPATREKLWKRAEEILPREQLGDFNSALMELGALICTPRSPACLVCPVRKHCEAANLGIQDRIPVSRKAKPTPLHRRCTFCVRHGERYLIEQRPARGRWAGMWQFITTEDEPTGVSARTVKGHLKLMINRPRRIGLIQHALTHRRYEFEVFECDVRKVTDGALAEHRRWVLLDELGEYPVPRPHLKIAELLKQR